jgi:hypothetical protein
MQLIPTATDANFHFDSIPRSPPPLSHITVQYFLSCGEANYTVSGHSKIDGKIRISGRIRKLYSQSDFRGKNLREVEDMWCTAKTHYRKFE